MWGKLNYKIYVVYQLLLRLEVDVQYTEPEYDNTAADGGTIDTLVLRESAAEDAQRLC